MGVPGSLSFGKISAPIVQILRQPPSRTIGAKEEKIPAEHSHGWEVVFIPFAVLKSDAEKAAVLLRSSTEELKARTRKVRRTQ
jgi:hypothetical protein